MYDIIGDIHGHADKLEELLKKLGYSKKKKEFSHSERKVIFVGDYINRGPKIPETLEIVRNMVESKNAIALMGNHEYHAICFHTKKEKGGYLRKHTIKNILQHYKTIKQFEHDQDGYDETINWFKTLPLFFENENFRVVHACWDDDKINFFKSLTAHKLDHQLITDSTNEDLPAFNAFEITLKGKDLVLPLSERFSDKYGDHTSIRVKWWVDAHHSTFKELCIDPLPGLKDDAVIGGEQLSASRYKEEYKPVFFGHYALEGKPKILRSNICCLDYSVAKEGPMVAYKYDGEKVLDNSKFVTA